MRRKWIVLGPLAILALLLFIAVGAEIVQQLWNWLLPGLFAWPRISFWQALGILALCRILFGGVGRRGFYPGMRRRMAERWERLSPEERERFRQGVRGRCGFGPPAAESKGL